MKLIYDLRASCCPSTFVSFLSLGPVSGIAACSSTADLRAGVQTARVGWGGMGMGAGLVRRETAMSSIATLSNHEGILILQFVEFFDLLSQKQNPLLSQCGLDFTYSH